MALETKQGTKLKSATALLIGKTGCGKSMLANMLLNLTEDSGKHYFKIGDRQNDVRVSLEPQAYTDKVHGLNLRVVDTPGFLDTEVEIQNRWVDVLKAVNIAGSDLSVVILVVNGNELASGATCLKIVQTYMMDAVFNKLIILFTHLKDISPRECSQRIAEFNRILTSGTLGAKFLISDQKSCDQIKEMKRKEIVDCIIDLKESSSGPIESADFAPYTKEVLRQKLKTFSGEDVTYDDLCESLTMRKELLEDFVSKDFTERIISQQNNIRKADRLELEELKKKSKWCRLQ